MQQNQTHAEGHYPNNDEIEISLTDLAKSLYAGRWFILLFTVACVALALGVAKVTAQYKSTSFWYFEGLVKLHCEEAGISLAEYNRIMDAAEKLVKLHGEEAGIIIALWMRQKKLNALMAILKQ